jgi:hypothetical protein
MLNKGATKLRNRKVQSFALIFLLLLPSSAVAEMSSIRMKTLLGICEMALKSSDMGTIKNIATQLHNTSRPNNDVKAKAYDDCLLAASGETENNTDELGLLNKIQKIAMELEASCRQLLNAAPETAVSNPICKDILLK